MSDKFTGTLDGVTYTDPTEWGKATKAKGFKARKVFDLHAKLKPVTLTPLEREWIGQEVEVYGQAGVVTSLSPRSPSHVWVLFPQTRRFIEAKWTYCKKTGRHHGRDIGAEQDALITHNQGGKK